MKWNAGSWPAPPVPHAGSAGWGVAADAFAEAECEACGELPWPPPLPGATPGSTGSAASIVLADAECEECELLWPTPLPDVTSGSANSPAANAFAEAECEACGELPWPPPLPGATPGSTGSAASIVLADAECEECELLWPTPLPDVTPGSANSPAANAFAEVECEACCEFPWPPLLRVGRLALTFPGKRFMIEHQMIPETRRTTIRRKIARCFRNVAAQRDIAARFEAGTDRATGSGQSQHPIIAKKVRLQPPLSALDCIAMRIMVIRSAKQTSAGQAANLN